MLRLARVPTVAQNDHDGAFVDAPQPFKIEPRQALADARAARPVVHGFAHLRQGPVAVLVAQESRDPREPGPEHERFSAHLARRRERLDEPEQQPRVTLHRPGDVTQHDERAGFADRPAPHPRHELSAGAEVAPEHRARGEAPAVRMQLVAASSPLLEARHQLVHESLGIAQLGRGHPVELPVAEHLATRVRVGGDDDALDILATLVVVAVGRDRDPPLIGSVRDPLVTGHR